MIRSLALLAKIDNIGIPGLTILVILGILFWRPIFKKIYRLVNYKNGAECCACGKKTKDYLIDKDWNMWCQKCGGNIKK